MIAGALISIMAVSILPGVFSVMDAGKATNFKALCSGVVRAKLQEYVNGVSDTTLYGTTYIPTGFEYSKKRWQASLYSSCASPTAAAPGLRETVYGNTINYTGQETVSATSTPAVSLGFQLWVMMKRYNPRYLTNGQPSRDCVGTHSLNRYDQFFRLGDAIEVTVTGMVRTDTSIANGGRGCSPVGKLYDTGHTSCASGSGDGTAPNPLLTCSATALVYPPRVPFRYYMGNDGKIRNYQAAITLSSGGTNSGSLEAQESHFRNAWFTGTTDVNMASIRGFAVSPDNNFIYILRSGELSLYTCTDQSVTVGSYTFQQTPNCTATPSQTWSSSNSSTNARSNTIENISTDFGDLSIYTDDKVYGMHNAGDISSSASSTFGTLMLANLGSAPALDWAETTAIPLPKNRPRIRGFYVAQAFPASATNPPNLFFFDNTCFTNSNTTGSAFSYCASVFSSGDTGMEQEARELPVQVEAISY
jgi:hypothetical protein